MTSSRSEVRAFLTYLEKERNDAANTIRAYRRDLEALERFLDDYHGGTAWKWESVDRLALRSFMGALSQQGLTKRSIARAMSVVRTFYRFLGSRYGIVANPAKGLRLPKLERRLPAVLDRGELEEFFRYAE